MYYLSSKKIIALVVLCCTVSAAFGQYNIKEHDAKKQEKKYSFGIHLGAASHTYRVEHSARFLEQNEILTAEGDNSLGIDVGLIGVLHPTKDFELRILPGINFGDRNVTYNLASEEEPLSQNLETTVFQIPLQVKYKSKPYKDMRGFVIVGGNLMYDLTSNKEQRLDPTVVKIEDTNLLGEIGAGFEFHFPLFTLAPEIKVSQGFLNQRVQNDDLNLSAVLSGLYSRVYTFSLNIE
ncbi:MAG: PorT family protein [Saprospiraceae bacterium]|nr:PorT family protein [Saprospiraceae bacterium]